MELTLQTIFNQLKEDIQQNNIEGYKNLLYIIYDNQKNFGSESTLTSDINDFLAQLFEQGIITQNLDMAGQKDCPTCHEDRPHNDQFHCLDLEVYSRFNHLVAPAIVPSLTRLNKERFKVYRR
jgi:hypothetical protein